MFVYKFRTLNSDEDYCRLKKILKNGKFWCSSFWELNDPMEGVFSIKYTKETFDKMTSAVNKIFGEKGMFKICSFSGERGFNDPSMWGYYTEGFKGLAIKIEVDDHKLKRVEYLTSAVEIKISNDNPDELIEKILLTKLEAWQKEDEYRFLKKTNNNFEKIGKITSICLGSPYDNLVNTNEIKLNTNSFGVYENYKKEIIKEFNKKIEIYNVKIINGRVTSGDKINI